VKIISKIFAGAQRTVVWLGPAYGDSNKAMEALANIPSTSSAWRPSRALWSSPEGSALLGLCQRAYWRRLWVYQELRASGAIDLMCGERLVQFQRLVRFLLVDTADKRLQEKISVVRQSPAAIMVALTHKPHDTSLEWMLHFTRNLQCADILDKAYAILNTIDSSRCDDIKADYTISVPELLNRILRSMHVYEEPSDLWLIEGQCKMLEGLFAVEQDSFYGTGSASSATSIQRVLHFARYQLQEAPTFVEFAGHLDDTYAWCRRHDHKAIGRLIWRDQPWLEKVEVESADQLGGWQRALYQFKEFDYELPVR
jgi:hypothetical protein